MPKKFIALVVLVVVTGCSAGPRPRGAAGPVRVTTARRLTGSWSTPLAGSPGGVATDRDGSIVMIDDDTVVALDRGGEERWSTPVPGAGLGWPALGHGLVVVPTLRDTGGPGGCVALDRATGARVWAYEEPHSEGVAVALAGDNVICALGSGVVVAVDRRTGARRWRVELAGHDPRIAVAIAERSALAIDEATATVVITFTFNSIWAVAMLTLGSGAGRGWFDLQRSGPVSSPVSTMPGVVAVGVSNAPAICTLDLRRKRARSCARVPAPDGFDPASIPLIAGGLLVIAARSGSVVAIDPATMKVRWSKQVPNPILAARPVSVDGVVLFSDWTRIPWAVQLADGSPVAIPKTDGWTVATVAGAGGGFEVAKRDMDGGWVEHWVPVAGSSS